MTLHARVRDPVLEKLRFSNGARTVPGTYEGSVSPLQDIPYPLSIPTEQLTAVRDSVIGYVARLEVRPGEQKIAVGVWDEVSGTQSFAHAVVMVGRGKKKG